MIHARSDYNERVQDSAGLIPDDEPVFLLRAQDILAPDTVRFWALKAKESGCNSTMVKMASDHADRMEQWQNENLRKYPDIPEEEQDKAWS